MARTATPLGIGQSTPVPFNPVAAQKTQVLAVSPFSLHLLKGVKGVRLSCRDVTANDRPTVTSGPRAQAQAQAQRGSECLIHCSLLGGFSRFVIHDDSAPPMTQARREDMIANREQKRQTETIDRYLDIQAPRS